MPCEDDFMIRTGENSKRKQEKESKRIKVSPFVSFACPSCHHSFQLQDNL
jgi:uncharacterized protein YlaI